ncbi:MAG: hypothetical protein LBD92_00270 [Oscillospiraceae bacterium]|jgi:hypothetical protein|nr:hypothetical protein [Oscillospiraceae bacterium]
MSNPHEHEHHGGEHCHEHTHKHDHAHEHTHGHTHEHTHSHEHSHEHEHPRVLAPEGAGAPKDAALLRYMHEHNQSHTKELRDIRLRFERAGYGAVAALIEDAAGQFERGSAYLQGALDALDAGAASDGKE